MNFIRKRLNKKGFTLVELLIVIAVLGIIAGIGVNTMSGVTETFKKKADIETARMIVRQIEIKVLTGDADLTGGLDAAACLKAFGESAYPDPQLGGKFEFTVTEAGVVTAKVINGTGDTAKTTVLADATSATEDITIATKAIE